jgi:outer membrane protein assembly factor BamB
MHLYVGTKHHVAAIDVKTGQEVWRTDLPKGTGLVCLLEADGRVFAGSGGYLHALDAQSGRILWSNELKGLGLGIVTLTAAGKSVQFVPTSETVVIPIVT